ncbi:MAG: glutamine amidotransferase [bacterium]
MWPDFDYNSGDLLWLGNWGLGWIVAVAILGAVILGLSAYDLQPLRPTRRYTLLGLRAMVFALAVMMLLEPAVDLKNVTKVKNHVPVLVDISRSMSLTASGDDTTRRDLALDAVKRLNLPKGLTDEDHFYHLLTFGNGVEEISPEGLDVVAFNAPTSDLTAALSGLAQRYKTVELGGVIVVSDGTDTGGIGGRTRRDEELDTSSLGILANVGAPVNAIRVGTPDSLRDLAIKRVKHDDFAFVRNRVAVDVEVQAIGFDGEVLQLTLERGGKPLQTRQITVEPGKTRYDVSFEFVPQQLGREVYAVKIPVMDQEVLASNNASYFVQKVIRDKIRVLQVVGRPTWDVRFLRQLLKRNPNIDLISFFILRTNENLLNARNDELSLIPFPTDELFSEQLGSFDLVVFQNFNFGPYAMRQYLPDIANFVRQGGGFVMVGGELSFADGGYAGSPIESILPVKLPSTTGRTVDLSEFRPELTDAGTRHPISQLAFDPASNREIWESLPLQHGTNVVLEAKPWANVLATHPRLTAGGRPMPVITVGEIDEGRVMALTTDSSWRWSFERAGDGGTAREYQMFWNNTMRWLIKDPELKLLRIEIEQDVVGPGESAKVTVRLQNPDYTPAPDVRGVLTVARKDLDKLTDAAKPTGNIPFQTDARGVAQIAVDAALPGVYEISAEVDRDTGKLVDRDLFLAADNASEFADILPRPDLLQSIAKATQGASVAAGTSLTPELRAPQSVQVNKRVVIQLWDNVVVFLLTLALLLVEWTLRRRWGRL